MPAKCCVPGCKSNYASNKESNGYVTTFKFPTNEALRMKWIQSIPRSAWEPTRNSVVCIKHFQDQDVITNETYKDKNGEIKTFPRKPLRLKENAVPQLFPGLPKISE